MGKIDWSSTHYLAAQNALGKRPTIKISHFSDKFLPNSNFAGVVVYHFGGKFEWTNMSICDTPQNGRFAYVMVKNTSKWSSDDFRQAGRGRVHDKVFRETLGEDFATSNASCGGFAIVGGVLKFSSIWLNTSGYCRYSDGDKNLSPPEQALVRHAMQAWVRGANVVTIPDGLHCVLRGGSSRTGSTPPLRRQPTPPPHVPTRVAASPPRAQEMHREQVRVEVGRPRVERSDGDDCCC